jgi:hypothetical protein
MPWHSIDSQSDLDALGKSVGWEDSSSLGYFASEANRAFYPTDVCRDGHHRKNLHLVCSAGSLRGAFLELAFIQAERFTSDFLDSPYIQGRVDSLRRVVLSDAQGESVLRCARLIYRFSAERPELPFEGNEPG